MNILTPFGYKDISEVNIGDKIIGGGGVENTLLGKTYYDYKHYADTSALKDYRFFLVNGKKLFGNQSIYCNGNVTHVYLLQKGDIIYHQDGHGEIISHLIQDEFDSKQGWWRLDVSGDHSYISDGILLHNANRFLVGGGTGNWNSNTNWSATDGGASGASFPVNGDAVLLNTNSGATNITVNVASACTSIVASATYTGTLTFNNTLTVAGTVTFITGMGIAGTGNLITATTATFTSGGKTLTGGLTISGTTTITFADNWTVNGTVTIGQTSLTTTLNGNTLNCTTHLTINVTSGIVNGTTNIAMTGTGTWSNPSNTSPGALRNNLTFNTSGTITISDVYYNTGTLTYTSGTVNHTGSLGTRGTAVTFNTNGMSWDNLSVGATSTITLSSNMTMNGIITFVGTVTVNSNTMSSVGCGTAGNTYTISGSANITITGGTVAGTAFTVNKTNNITFAGSIIWTVTTFTHTASGSFTTTGSTLTMSGSRTFAGAVTWNHWTTSGTGTLTTNALQTLAGTLTVGDGFTTTFAGSNGVVSCANLTLGASSTLVIPTNATVTSTTTINASGSVINGAFTLNTGGLTMSGNLTGTLSLINFNATGTWSGSGVVIHNTTVNTAGTLTISGTVHYKTGTFTYTAGTVTVTSSTLSIDGSCTFAGALTWNHWTVSVASTVTINALQTLNGTMTLQGATTFAGTNGWTANSFVCTTAGLTHTFKQAVTYTITGSSGAFIMVGTPKNKIKLISASTPTKAILTFTNPQTVYYVSPTDIDSSAGSPVLTMGGTITNTLNWNQVLHPAIVTITG